MRSPEFAAGTRKTKRFARAAKQVAGRNKRAVDASHPGIWLTVAQAAETLRCSPSTIRNRIKQATIDSRKSGRVTEVYVTL